MAGILVITTGGTIGAMPVADIHNQPHIKTMPQDKSDMVRKALGDELVRYKARCISMEPRDSNFIDEAYRAEIARHIEGGSEDRILITHGTDTLLETAEFFFELSATLDAKGKRIIVTGAMVPLSNGKLSDGYRNIEFSLSHLSNPVFSVPVGVVLSGFDALEATTGEWKPYFYPYESGRYEMFHHPSDHRYNRLKLKNSVSLAS